MKRNDDNPMLAAFCRSCLQFACAVWLLLLLACAVLAVTLCPEAIVVVFLALGAGAYYSRPRFRGGGWAFGTARLAGLLDLMRGGLLRSGEGLLIGKTSAPRVPEAARLLWKAPRSESETVCRLFRDAVQRKGSWVRLAQGQHTVVFAPTGRGKGTGLVVPNLLTYSGSCVVVDCKGELAQLTAAHRRRVFGHKVVLLDPFKVVTQKPDTLNPLSFIRTDSPQALDDGRAISEATVVRTGEEKEPHWNDSAELWIWAMIALVLFKAPPERRNLQTVCTLLSDPAEMKQAMQVMRESDLWEGMLARLGNQLSHYVDRELGSTLTTATRHLRFLSTVQVAASTRSSSFDPAELKSGRMTIYLVLPTEYLRTQSPLLRLWISSLLRAVIQGGLGERNKVLFLLDEAAALGHMDCIDDAVAQLRGYGLRLFFLYQSMGQLQRCFPDGQAETFLSNCDNQIFFGLNDVKTAEYVSTRLGETTITIHQGSGGTSYSTSHDRQGGGTSSYSSNSGWNASETGRKLFKPEEVLALDERLAVVFTPAAPPLITRLVRYYEPEFKTAPGLGGRREMLRLALWCARYALLAAAVGGLALMLALTQ
jgi:type IV secretion system protein VirD4